MNIFQLLSDLEQVDPEIADRLDSRRAVFKHMSGLSKKLTAATLPLAIGAIFNKAYAQTTVGTSVADVLNFALKLEYLEFYFYQQRTALPGLSAANAAALNLIATDEANHIAFLRTVLGALAIPPPTAATFDFTGGRGNNAGPFADYRANLATYLALAQSFEDLGVRAYKGTVPSLIPVKTVLTAALNIHSIEARHAAQIRAMRRALVTSPTTPPSQGIPASPYNLAPKSWVAGVDGGGPAPIVSAAVYGAGINLASTPAGVTFPAESNTTQAGTSLSNAMSSNVANFPVSAFSEAFDEGLDSFTVSAIARQFTVATSTLFL